jgi:hypothetical protein
MLIAAKPKSLQIFWVLTIVTVVITTFAILLLGELVGKKIEGVMILHDFFTAISIMTGAGIIGILMFSSETIRGSIFSMQMLAVLSAASVFLVILTGVYGYVYYRLPDDDSAKSIINRTFPFAHEPLFETMEYVGLIGSIWATMIAYLVFHWKEKMFAYRSAKYTVVSLIGIGIIFALVISLTGIIPAKIASVQG